MYTFTVYAWTALKDLSRQEAVGVLVGEYDPGWSFNHSSSIGIVASYLKSSPSSTMIFLKGSRSLTMSFKLQPFAYPETGNCR